MKIYSEFNTLANILSDASVTYDDEYPIIEKDMVTEFIPDDVIQWDQRSSYKDSDKSKLGISFYCVDKNIMNVVNKPDKYLDELNKYGCIIGMDISPFDDMPINIQKANITLNLGLTYYYGKHTHKVIPNVRLGDNRTLSSLSAYPKDTVIAIGTSGFVKKLNNRKYFAEQMKVIIKELRPKAIIVYGIAKDIIVEEAVKNNIPIYQYDSFMQKKNKKQKLKASQQ